MIIGYSRVSKGDGQDTALQRRAFDAAGVQRVFEDKASGGQWDRPALHRMLDQLRPDDVVVVWKLDRLSRSLKDLLAIIERIDAAGAGFRSLTDPVDTTSAAGRMMMAMIGAFAEYERAMIRERTRAGLEAAAAAGRRGGRRRRFTPAQEREIARSVIRGERSAADAARLHEVSPATISRIVAAHSPEQGVA